MFFCQTQVAVPTSDLVRSYKMENLTFVETNCFYGKETHAVIEHADGSFTSMLKSTYDAMQAEQSTPMVTGDVNAD